jgi:molecular chaperone GrpE
MTTIDETPAAPDAAEEPVTPEPEAAPGDGAPDVSAAVEEAFEREMAEARRLADENWDRYLRAEAELDNARKRAARRQREAVSTLRRELLLRFLDVADNLERALSFGDADPEALLGGVETTYRELRRLFEREGVQPIPAMDEAFDPAVHEAVAVQPVPDADHETVVAVDRPGYTLDGELLRAARVIVGRPPDGAPTDEAADADGDAEAEGDA